MTNHNTRWLAATLVTIVLVACGSSQAANQPAAGLSLQTGPGEGHVDGIHLTQGEVNDVIPGPTGGASPLGSEPVGSTMSGAALVS